MDDRERVLMNIAVDTSGYCFDTFERLNGGWKLKFRFGRCAPQFVPEEMATKLNMPLKPGDIIRCSTNPNHAWGISELVEKTGFSDFLLRMIGGEKLLNMGNESVDVLRFMSPYRLYTGHKFQVYKWASSKAFSTRYNPQADYFKRCGGVDIDGDDLIIWSRPHIWASEKTIDGVTLFAQPRRFAMKWSDKTKLKDIVGAMLSQGFADEFEYLPTEPTEGQAGRAKITRDALLGVLNSA